MPAVDLRAPQVSVDLQHGDPATINVVSAEAVPSTLELWVGTRAAPGTALATLSGTSITGGRSYVLSEEDSLALRPSRAYQLVARDSATGVTWFTGPVSPSTEGAGGPTSQTVTLALSELSVSVDITVAAGAGSSAGVTDHGSLTGLGDNDHTQYQLVSARNQADGYAGLDGSGTVPDNRIPSTIARDTEVTAAVSAHNASGSAHADLRTLIDGKAAAGYTPAVSPVVSSYLILGASAVDGTATEMTLYSADPTVVNASTLLPDGLVAFGTFPLGDGSPGANWNYVFDQLGVPSTVVVVGANAGVDRLTPGALDEPWEELDAPIGTFAGFYVSDLVRLLLVRTSYGWKTIDPTVDYLTAAQGAVGFGDPWGAADDEYEALSSTDLTLSCDGTVAGAWSTSNLGDLPNGIDIRVKVRHHRLQNSTQRYMEILTQQNPANWGGDNFEAAIFTPDNTFGELTPSVPIMFWEHTPDRDLWPTTDGEVGYLADVADYDPPNDVRGEILTADAALSAGEWATLRWVHDTALETVSFYREVPITGDDTTTDGREWQLIDSWTWALADSIDSGVTEDWSIGLSALIDVAWMEVYSGPDGTKIADIQPSHLATAGLAATSVTDGEGNVWTCGGASAVGRVNPVVAGGGTPDAHAASHANGGSDEVSIDASQITTGTIDDARVPSLNASKTTAGTFDIARIPDRPPLQIQVTGRYMRTGDRGGAAAPTTNRVFYLPIWIETDCTIDRIGVFHEATTGGASSVARMAIYTNSGMLPASKVVEATVDLTTAAAFKAATISQALTRGLHWLAVASQPTSGSPTYSWGPPTIMCGDTTGTASGALFDTSTYSSTLPSTAAPGSVATQPPLVYVRCA